MDKYQNLYDVIIIGGGPAGLAAAIYSARAKQKTLLLEKERIGGQVALTAEVMNYPGVFKASGEILTSEMARQATGFGAEIKIAQVKQVELQGEIKKVITDYGTFESLTVINAMGVKPRVLGFEGESEYKGHGIAYCATCDGEFFTGKDIFVIGGGLAAAEEAMFLTRYGKSVTMIVREPELICPEPIIEKVYQHQPAIKVYKNCVPVAVRGGDMPNTVVFRNTESGEEISYTTEDDFLGVFIFSGYLPNTQLLEDQVELDRGYVVTDELMQTNVPGVYAVGDLRIKNLRQAVTASSDGAIASTTAKAYIDEMHEKLNIPSLMQSVPVQTADKPVENSAKADQSVSGNQFIDAEMIPQLQTVFSRIEKQITIHGHINDSDLGKEMRVFLNELQGISDNCLIQIHEETEGVPFITFASEDSYYPYRFNGIPGGHEFTSFILAIYHLAGPKKPLQESLVERLENLSTPVNLDVIISLTCTKCPGLVNTITQVMSYSPQISLQIYDLNHAAEMKERYRVMSVPCIVLNEERVEFGLKDAEQIVELLEAMQTTK